MTTTHVTPGRTASNFGRFTDPAPHIPPAGKVLTDPNDSVEACVKHEVKGRPLTPPHIKPYRRSYKDEPGRITTHYGKALDAPPPDIRFGHTTDLADSAATLIQPPAPSAFSERQRQLRESHYASQRKEPVGRSATANVESLPSHARDPEFRFGQSTRGSESAKAVMYPADDPRDTEDAHRKYARSHGDFDAGEQRTREYDWSAHGIDPHNFRFGAKGEASDFSVAQALQPEVENDRRTVVVKKILEDFKDVTRDHLGEPKNLGFGERGVDPGHTFGRANKFGGGTARDCLRGNYGPEEQLPDRDLGRSLRTGTRAANPGTPVPSERVFGVPTVRTDIPKPARKRVTDFQNYGDEAKAAGLIYPSKYAHRDVFEEDFLSPVDKRTMYDLQVQCGFNLSDGEFESVWNLAASYTTDNSVSVETFRRAADELGL